MREELLREVRSSAMRAKAEVIVKLISPPEVSVRCEEHLTQDIVNRGLGGSFGTGMNNPPTASVGLPHQAEHPYNIVTPIVTRQIPPTKSVVLHTRPTYIATNSKKFHRRSRWLVHTQPNAALKYAVHPRPAAQTIDFRFELQYRAARFENG